MSRILWATQLSAYWLGILFKKLPQYQAVVVRADLKNRAWAAPYLAQLKAWGGTVYAYIRGLHFNLSPTAPYEVAVRDLVVRSNAILKHWSGETIMHPSGVDAYINPLKMPAQEYAQITVQLAWDKSIYTGFLIDGLVTNQIYCRDPIGANFGNEYAGDFAGISKAQRDWLKRWIKYLRFYCPEARVIGNGAWEPNYIRLRPRGYPARWEYQSQPPVIHPSFWIEILDGAMDELKRADARVPGGYVYHPYYHQGNPYQQGPTNSQSLDMHARCAKEWLAKGKMYWVGSNLTATEWATLPKEIATIN